MKVLLTGATGLIGKRLGIALVAAGHELTILSRSAERARKTLPFPAKIIEASSEQIPKEALVGQEAIVHLAGESIADGPWNEGKKKRMYDSRVGYTKNLVQTYSQLNEGEKKLRVFVLGTAIGWYGDRGDHICTESEPPGTDFLAKLVVDWESAGREIQKYSSGIRFVSVRTGVVLANGGGALERMVSIFKNGFGGPIAGGRSYMSWIHIDDIVGIFRFCLETPIDGAVNGVAPRPETNSTLTKELAAVLDRPALLPVPGAVLELTMGEMARLLLLSSQRASSELIQRSGYKFKFPDLHTALADLLGAIPGSRKIFICEQWVPKTIDEVWPFFATETNLEELTPAFLKFKVLGKSTPQLERGTRIDYRLKVHGIPMKWQSEISDWSPPYQFSDQQIHGPYRHWYHTHTFEKLGSGTLIRDRVIYELPLKWIGSVLGDALVKRDLDQIFSYRRKVIGEKYGTP